jgi:tetratricopeptide (TPR) repeat protein
VLAQGAGNAAEKDEARQLLMEARELRPDDAEIHCQLGQLAQGAGEYKEAAVLFEHSLELYPAHWDAVYRLAQCRFRLGEDDEGERLMAAYKRMRIALQSETKKFATGEDVLTAQRWRQLSGIFRQSRLTKLAQLTDRRAAAEVAPVASAGDGASR